MAIDRDNLIDAYVDAVVSEMDTKTLQQMAMDNIYNVLLNYTDAELVSEIQEYEPELLKEYTK